MAAKELATGRKGFPPRVEFAPVTIAPPTTELRAAPVGFDALIDWVEGWSTQLVLLEEYPLAEVHAAVQAVDTAVEAHRIGAEAWLDSFAAPDTAVDRLVRILRSDHAWFRISVDQLWWFLGVVESEDHGGHRQALGQFGRVLAESLRRHRADERRLEAPRGSAERPVSLRSRETLISSSERTRG